MTQRLSSLDLGRNERHAEFGHHRNFQKPEENRERLPISDAVDKDEVLYARRALLTKLQRQRKRYAAAERMPDNRQVAQVFLLDECLDGLRLIDNRIMLIYRLVGCPEAPKVERDNPMIFC